MFWVFHIAKVTCLECYWGYVSLFPRKNLRTLYSEVIEGTVFISLKKLELWSVYDEGQMYCDLGLQLTVWTVDQGSWLYTKVRIKHFITSVSCLKLLIQWCYWEKSLQNDIFAEYV